MSRFVNYPPPVPNAHPLYPESLDAARAIQNDMRTRLEIANRFEPIKTIAGVDVGYDIVENRSRASIVVLSFPELTPIDAAIAYVPTGFPYIPGFLSFREIPAIIEALKLLKAVPQMLMVDGQGIAHPRRLGIATHLGILTGLPAIGVAKSPLVGGRAEPGPHRGDRIDLTDRGEKLGVILRSRDGVKPLYVSPGHRIDIETSLEIVLACLTKYRLPEPTRLADKYSKVRAGELVIGGELL